MITSNGQRVFIDNKSSITCYNYNNTDEVWQKYGANYTSGATKDGKVVKTTENVKIGFNANKGGNRVVAHNMGTFHIDIFEINIKTMVWEKIQTLENIEYSTSSSGNYVFDFKGDNLLIYVNDSNDQGNLHYYAFNNTTHSYDNKFTINNISGITNENTIRNVVTNKVGTIFAISDTNGNTYQSVNDNNNGTVKIYDVDSGYNYTLRSTLTSSNDSGLFGDSISLNLNGDRIVISEPIEGALYPYSYDSNTTSWSLIGGSSLDFFDLSSSRYNNIVKMNSNGDAFFISEFDNNDNENGVFYGYYQDNSNNWNKYEELSGNFYETIDNSSNNLLGSGFSFTNTSHFGSIMSSSSQGNRLLIGSNDSTNDINGFIIKLKKDPTASNQSLTSLGVSDTDIIKLELTPQELVGDSGLNTSELKNLGVGADTLLTGGTSESDLLDSGFGLGDIVSASNDLSSLVSDPSNNVTALDLLGSTSVSDLLTKGISVNDLLGDISSGDASNNATVDYSQFKDANVSATDLKDSGIDATTLKDAAYSPSDLVSAGFAVTDLKDAAIPAGDLKSAGLGLTDLDSAFSPEDLVGANFDDSDFENAGYTVEPTQTLSVSLGAVTFSQEVKTVVKNDDISGFSTSLPDTDALTNFLATNPELTNVLTVEADDSSGNKVYDVSSGPIVLTLDLPDLDPTESHVLCKYDNSNNLMIPQPKGYPVTLTYNSELQKFTGTLTSLSNVSTSFAATAPNTDAFDPQIYLVGSGYEHNGYFLSGWNSTDIIFPKTHKPVSLTSNMFNITFKREDGTTITNSHLALSVISRDGNYISKTPANYASKNGRWKRICRQRRTWVKNVYVLLSLALDDPENYPMITDIHHVDADGNYFFYNFKVYRIRFKVKHTRLRPQYVSISNIANAITEQSRGPISNVTTINSIFDILPPPEVSLFEILDPTVYKHRYNDKDSNEVIEYYTNQVKTLDISVYFVSRYDRNRTNLNLGNIIGTNVVFGKPNFPGGSMGLVRANGVLDTTSETGTTVVSVTIPPGIIASSSNPYPTNENSTTFNYTIDTLAPTLEIICEDMSNNGYSNSGSLNMIFQASEDIRTLESSYFTIENGTLVGLEQATNDDGTIDFSKYVANLVPSIKASVSQITIMLNKSTIMDLGGNINTSPSNSFIWNYDGVVPTLNIKSSDISNNDYYYNDYINIEIEISEELKSFTTSNITVTGGYIARFSNITNTNNYSMRLYPNDSINSSTVTISVVENTVQDILGNYNTYPSNTFIWNVDTTKPKLTLSSSIASGSSTDDPFIQYSIYSTKQLQTLELDDFTVVNGSVIDLEGDNTNQNYKIKLFPLSNLLTSSIKINAYSVTDLTNNTNNIASNIYYWKYSGNAPIVSINSTDIDLNFESQDISINAIIKISDTDITLLQSHLDVSGGVLSDFRTVFDDYHVTFTANNPYDTNTLKITAGTVSDSNNIGNNPSNIFTWKWNKSRPSIVISSSDISNEGTYNYNSATIRFTPNEDISNFTVDDITCTNGTLTNFEKVDGEIYYTATLRPAFQSITSTEVTKISNWTWTEDSITIPQIEGYKPQVVTLNIGENSFEDSYSFTNTQSSNNYVWYYDSVRPNIILSSNSMSNGDINNLSKTDITFTTTKPLTNFIADKVTVVNGYINNFIKVNDLKYTADLYPSSSESANLQITIFIDLNKVQDDAGNYNYKSDEFIWKSDREPPVITKMWHTMGIINNAGTNIPWRWGPQNKLRVFVEFNKPISVITAGSFSIIDNVDINGNEIDMQQGPLYDQTNLSLKRYRYQLLLRPLHNATLQSNYYKYTVYIPPNSIQDELGNVNDVSSQTFTIIKDVTAPKVSIEAYKEDGTTRIYSGSATNDTSFWVDFVSSKKVHHQNGIDLTKITTVNCTLTQRNNIANKTWRQWKYGYNYGTLRLWLTPTGNNDTISISVADGLFKDARNTTLFSTAADSTFTWTPDFDGPILTIGSSTITNSSTTNIQDISINFTFNEAPVSFTASDISYTNSSIISNSFTGSGTSYSMDVRSDPSGGLVNIFLPENTTVQDAAGNTCLVSNPFSWTYVNISPKISNLYSNDVSNNGYTSKDTIRLYLDFTQDVTLHEDTMTKIISSGNGLLNNFVSEAANQYYIDIEKTTDSTSQTITISIPKDTFYNNLNTYNNESYNFTYYYLNNIPEIEITSTTIASGKTTNDNSIDLILKEKNGLTLYDFDVTDITTEPNNNNYTITDFSGNGSSYTCTLNAAQDASIYFILNPGKYKNISNQFNTATNEFVWIRNTQPVTIEIYSNSINNNSSSTDENISLIISTNKPVNIEEIREYLTVSNATLNTLTGTSPGIEFVTYLIPKAKNLQSSVSIEEDVIYDEYGNVNTNASNTFSWTFKGINPTVDLTCPTIPNGAISSLEDISFNVEITGDVVTLLQSHISVTNGYVSNFSEVSDNFYEFTFTPNLQNVDCNISIPAGSFVDQYGTANFASSTFTWIFNNTEPFVTITCDDVTSGSYSNLSFFNINFAFSTKIKNFTLSDIDISGGTIDSLVEHDNNIFKSTFTPNITSGQLSLNIQQGTCNDANNNNPNAASQPTGGFLINYDISRPSMDISSSIASGSSSNDLYVTLFFEASEDITTFDFDKIIHTNCVLGGKRQLDLRTFRVIAQPINNNQVSIQLPEGVCMDAGGNTNTASSIFEWTFDTTAVFFNVQNIPDPSTDDTEIYLSSNLDGKSSQKILYFSIESNDTLQSALTEDDLSFTNIEIVPETFVQNSINSNKFTVAVETLFEGVNTTFFIPANVVNDLAGNDNIESTVYNWIYDSSPPIITINSPDISSGDITNDESITIYFDASEPIVGFDKTDLNIIGGFIDNTSLDISNNGLRYIGTLKPNISSGGEIKVDINTNSYTDNAGFDNLESESFFWTCDRINPRLSLITTTNNVNNGSYYDSQTISMELITLNDTSLNITASDISLVNGTIEDFTFVNSTTFSFNLLATNSNIETSIFLPASSITDSVGNGNDATDVFKWIFDAEPLTITSISSPQVTNNGTTNNSIVLINFVLSESVFNLTSSIISTSNCNFKSFKGDGINYSAEFETTEVNDIIIEFSNTQNITTSRTLSKQLSGNNLTFNWSYDNTLPSTIITGLTQLNNVTSNTSFVDLKFTTSKTTTNFSQDTIRLLGDSSISNFDGSGTEYSARFTPSSTGTIVANIDAGSYTDTVGNLASNDVSYTWYYDNTAPTVEISSNITSGSSSDSQYIDLSFVLSENVSDFTIDDINVTNGSIGEFSGSGQYYRAQLKPKVSNSVSSVVVPIGTITDIAGNTNSSASNTYTWTYTGNAVTLELTSSDISNNNYYKFNDISINVYTNLEITGFTVDDISATNGTISNLSNIDSNNWVFNFTSDNANVESSVYIPAGGVMSLSNNSDLNLDSNTFSWTYDNTKPTIEITSSTISSGDYYNKSFIFIDISASEDVTLLDTSINLTNATMSLFRGSGREYSTKLEPNGITTGQISAIIPINGIYDVANNYNDASSNLFIWNYDTDVPTIEISSNEIAHNGTTSNDVSNVLIKVIANENINSLSLNNFSTKNCILSDLSGSGSYYTVNATTNDWTTDREIQISVGQNKIEDLAGNKNSSASNTFIFNINAEVIRKKTTAELTTLFSNDNTIASSDLLSTNEINVFISKSTEIDSKGLSQRSTLPTFVKKTMNRKIFNVMIEQVFENATNKRAKFDKEKIPLKSKVSTLLENVTDLVIANSNQKVEFTDLTTSYTDEAVYIPLSTVNDYIEVELINGALLKITQTQADVFSVTKDGTSLGTYDADDDNSDTLMVDNYTIMFGSATMTYDPPNTTSKKYYRCGITGGAVNDSTVNNSAFETWFDDNDLSWNNSIGLSINIGGSTYRGWKFDEMKTYNDASMTIDEFSDHVISFCQDNSGVDRSMLEIAETNPTYDYTFVTFRSSSTAAAYLDTSSNYNYVLAAADLSNISIHEVNEVVIPTEASGNDASGGESGGDGDGGGESYTRPYVFMPCFLKGTKILTTSGYKLIQELVAGEDILIDDSGKELECKEVKKFTKKYDGVEFPYVVPKGSKLSERFTCNEDLYLTHNHSIYIPHMNKYVPSSLMKMSQDKTKVEMYTYYHVFTENFFTDVIIANGIPCESHSKYIKQTINNIDSTGKLLRKILNSCNAQGSGMRNRMTNKEFNKIVKQFKKKKGKKNRKK
ncbi:MAG: hypothetical protein CMJ38_00485 [Phycisphaerae bacterium]|nr:hypothetical protein [Phycisphaerae bacterium]